MQHWSRRFWWGSFPAALLLLTLCRFADDRITPSDEPPRWQLRFIPLSSTYRLSKQARMEQKRLDKRDDGADAEQRPGACVVCFSIPPSRPMSPNDARKLLEKQAAHQKRVIDGCGALRCFADIDLPEPSKHYGENVSHTLALEWAALRYDAKDLLEMGAAYARGSTVALAKAAARRYRSVTSIEAVEQRFLYGKRFFSPRGQGKGLPVRLVLGSPVAAADLVTEAEYRHLGGRDTGALRAEAELALRHGQSGSAGILPALLAVGDFGLCLLDGGTYGVPAEWAAVQATKSVVRVRTAPPSCMSHSL